MGRWNNILLTSYTTLSIFSVGWRINSVLRKSLTHNATFDKEIGVIQAGHILHSLIESPLTVALLSNLAINLFLLVVLLTKAIFFGQLSSTETQKVGERLMNHLFFKGFFLTWVIQPDALQVALWITWFLFLGCLKIFLGVAKDRLERLNASPSATVWAHLRVFSALFLLLLVDFFWIQLSSVVSSGPRTSTFWLLLFEPLSIAFETLQAILVYGVQLIETFRHHSDDDLSHCQGLHPSDRSAPGATWELKGAIVRNIVFFMEIITLLMALGHCLHIWWLRGFAFQPIDAVLFLNLRALLSAILKRVKSFMRLRTAMNTLQGALPDATKEELVAYDDECAICKEPMARAKKLPCGHLFHLPCLRSWLDQGLGETYSCPTCRRPLFVGSMRASSSNTIGQNMTGADQLDRNISIGADGLTQNETDLLSAGPFSTQQWNSPGIGMWRFGIFRGVGLDTTWPSPWPHTGTDVAGPSSELTRGGFGRFQTMMRHLSGVGGNHTHNTADENSWRFWQMATPDAGPVQRPFSDRPRTPRVGLRFQNIGRGHGLENNGMQNRLDAGDARMASMVNTAREVLPHIPEEIIIQDLRRTNSVALTINNLL